MRYRDIILARALGKGKRGMAVGWPLMLGIAGGGGGGTETTITGVSPLLLEMAMHKPLKSLTQYGKVTQADTPTPAAPSPLVCNNGELQMLNLANMKEDNIVVGKYINNNGNETSAPSNFYYSPFIPVKASTAYTLKTSRSLNYSNFMEYDASKGFLQRTLYGSADTPAGAVTTHTTRADTAYIRFGSNINGQTLTANAVLAIEWMFTEGATPMDYVPYGQLSVVGTPEVISITASGADTQTATAPDLFAVGDYADEAELISGAVTRKCRVVVFDGTENNWSADFNTASGTIARFYMNGFGVGASGRTRVLCTHFKFGTNNADGVCFIAASGHLFFERLIADGFDTKEKWLAYLAAQYAAGTPVIVICPLAEETTESVTPQPLSTVAGDNTVSWTAAVSGKTMSAVYTKAPEHDNLVGSALVGTAKAG